MDEKRLPPSYWCRYEPGAPGAGQWVIVGKADQDVGLTRLASGKYPEDAWSNFYREHPDFRSP
jgi:hypothetical protein